MRLFTTAFLLALFVTRVQALDVIYAHLAFKSPDGLPYVETQFCILNNSLHFVKTPEKSFQASYNVRIYFVDTHGDTVQNERYSFNSPIINDPKGETFDLVDIRRNALPSGTYRIGLVITDKNGNDNFTSERSLKLYFPNESPSFSSPLLVKSYRPSTNPSNYTRAGYDIIPYPLAYFPDSLSRLTIYYEAYNLHKSTTDTAIQFHCVIRDVANEALNEYIATDSQPSDSLNIFFASLDISRLTSGRYFLHLMTLDKNLKVLSETGFHFARALASKDGYKNYTTVDISHTFAATLNGDSLFWWLGGLEHTANGEERVLIEAIASTRDSLRARQFIYQYMLQRQPEDPQGEWLAYRRLFHDVEASFASPVRRGYETDRGRVYMQYGAPNQRNVSTSEPGALPYEVWQYYRIPNGQTNVYFIFYLPGLATNDYKLIQSDARGELQDPRWKHKIYPMNPSANPDETNVREHVGQRIDSYIPR